MIHTCEIRTKSSDFSTFLKFKENPGLCRRYPGIKIEPYKEGKDPGKHKYKLKARINLNRTVDPDNHLGIYSGQNPERILEVINQAFSELGLPAANFWTLTRVDFTIDIETPYVAEYLAILGHGDHKHDPDHKKNGLYIPYSDRGITVNFYSKEAEQEARGAEAAEQARNLLRLEVQCRDKKLSTMFTSLQDRPARDLASMLMVNDGESLVAMVNKAVGKELLKITGENDHISQRAALEKINSCQGIQKQTKAQLIELLHRINRKNSSISIVRERWWEAAGRSKTAFKARMDALYAMGINPICLPAGAKVERLENLYQLYLGALKSEYIAASVAGAKKKD